MKRSLGFIAVCALIAAIGCGGDGDSSGGPSGEPAETGMPETAASEAPSVAESTNYVEGYVPAIKQNTRSVGADLFGTPDIKCAATGGPETECLVEIPFRRLDDCYLASTTMMVINREEGLGITDDSGEVESRGQICYIGDNGEPVPEP